jgi:hypothetical protein
MEWWSLAGDYQVVVVILVVAHDASQPMSRSILASPGRHSTPKLTRQFSQADLSMHFVHAYGDEISF